MGDHSSFPDPWVDMGDGPEATPNQQGPSQGAPQPPPNLASASFPAPTPAPQASAPEPGPPQFPHPAETTGRRAVPVTHRPERVARPEGRPSALLDRLGDVDLDDLRPEGGFRGFVYEATNGLINLGLSKDARHRRELINLLTAMLGERVYFIGVFTQKGGLGKTTNTTAVGATIATHRTEKVIALDVNPDGGSMALRIPRTTRQSILDLRDAMLHRDLNPTEFGKFINENPKTRLDAIVMPPGEKPTKPLSADDFRMVADALIEKYPYRIVLVDCGTNLTSPVMDGLIPRLDLLVTVTTPVRDEASVTLGGFDALTNDGYGDLVSNSVTLMVHRHPKNPDVRIRKDDERVEREVRADFAEATRRVIDIPYDPSLGRGDTIKLNSLQPDTNLAYLTAGAEVVTALRELG